MIARKIGGKIAGTIDTPSPGVRMRGMGAAARRATVVLCLGAAGCGTGVDRPAVLMGMSPGMANDELPLAALITGTSFRPTYRFDPVAGTASLDLDGFSARLTPSLGSPTANVETALSDVVWQSETLLQAQVPAGIAAGTYDLVVADPRGQSSRLARAFASLGPDLIPPVVTIASPADDAIVAAGAPVSCVVQADDGFGQVVSLEVTVRTGQTSVSAADCGIAAQAKAPCELTFVAPTPPSSAGVLFVDATAIDGGGNRGTAEIALELVAAPRADAVAPARGSTLGSTLVTVTGANFLSAQQTTVSFGGLAATISAWSPTSMTVETPLHVAGAVDVTVEIGGAVASLPGGFLYVDPPLVRQINPSYGPTSGGTAVSVVGDNFTQATEILIGGAPLTGAIYQTPNRITGFTPPGSSGPPSPVGTYDPVLDSQNYGRATFSYGADGGVPGGTDGGNLPPIPCLSDVGCAGSDP
ncbi:MAG TPA: IPT/TIG domain-containing protein [Polyangia bacterium]|nr:IPT/TIG domain-containing protein [Polyangia bacterium]